MLASLPEQVPQENRGWERWMVLEHEKRRPWELVFKVKPTDFLRGHFWKTLVLC